MRRTKGLTIFVSSFAHSKTLCYHNTGTALEDSGSITQIVEKELPHEEILHFASCLCCKPPSILFEHPRRMQTISSDRRK